MQLKQKLLDLDKTSDDNVSFSTRNLSVNIVACFLCIFLACFFLFLIAFSE